MTPLFKVFMPEDVNEKDLKAILFSGNLSYGENGRKFEQLLKDFIGNPYVLVTGNNNYASLVALAAVGLKAGDEVIASPMACLASNQPIINFQAKVVWADIDPATGSLDPDDVRKKITSKTKAIVHYHWGGYPGYIDEINGIGASNGIPVIDDSIEAFGSKYKGRMMGNTGTPITLFSFQAVRLPNCIDGGAVAFNSEELYKKALLIRDFGIDRKTFRDNEGEISPFSDISVPGYNALMSELNAYIGIKQMGHVPLLLEKQRSNAKKWNEIFATESGRPLGTSREVLPNYWVYSFLAKDRRKLRERLRAEGFYTSRVHLRNDLYSVFGKRRERLPGVDAFAEQQISVPSGWWANI